MTHLGLEKIDECYRVVPFPPAYRQSADWGFKETERLGTLGLRTTCRGGGMADAADLKSVVRKDVRVRLPPSAPYLFLLPD